MKKVIIVLFLLSGAFSLLAQEQLLGLGYEYLNKQDYAKAIEIFEKVFDEKTTDTRLIDAYLKALMGAKNYKQAEKIAKAQLKKNKSNEFTLLLAKIYTESGESKKANKVLRELIEANSKNESDIRQLGATFERNELYEYALKLYEDGRENSGNKTLFAEELANLYHKKGDFEKAVSSLLDLASSTPLRLDNVKITLPRIMTDAAKKEIVKTKILERTSKDPDNVVYPDLLAWHYINEDDYEGAFIQIKAIDTRLNEDGKRVLNFAKTAAREKKFDAALEAFDFILAKGKTSASYMNALTEKLNLQKVRIEEKGKYTEQEVKDLVRTYEQYFEDYPQSKTTEIRRTFANLVGRYTDDIGKAKNVLKELVAAPNAQQVLRGQAKLDLGDYELIDGNNWQATLLYSQVDKEFKNDLLGEEARFRNAKLSYYMGDFEWAQGQLDVLKASTSELIANDALNLSVLITENTPADSNYTPLLMYSRSELLIFRNQFDKAIKTLDSISSYYTDNPLVDDILFSRAKIAIKQQNFQQAADFLKQVYEKHGDDILADDAIFLNAELQEKYLNNPGEAKFLYEKIILDYPGSTLIGQARKAFRRLRGDAPKEEL